MANSEHTAVIDFQSPGAWSLSGTERTRVRELVDCQILEMHVLAQPIPQELRLYLRRTSMEGNMIKYIKAVFIILVFMFLVSCTSRNVEENAFGHIDHVFLIIMENQAAANMLGNPHARFINNYAQIANRATNYFAVGHPSAPNYLAIVGGSNFGLTSDAWPDWVNNGCVDNAPRSIGCNSTFIAIATAGMDSPVVATATSKKDCNSGVLLNTPPIQNNCALRDYPATGFIPESIADQLVAYGKSWKTYQESLPTTSSGPAGVNYSDGIFSNLSPPNVFKHGLVRHLYAVKHNPFAYFHNIQLGTKDQLSLSRVVGFDGPEGLWADLAGPASQAPNLFFIVPNQCHDMHGLGYGGAESCAPEKAPASHQLVSIGDAQVEKLVNRIKASDAWRIGRNVIVLVWDENDYANAPNRVVLLVETNYASNGRVSNNPYDHFALLRTLEAGFGLPCLNHACDSASKVMSDLFGG